MDDDSFQKRIEQHRIIDAKIKAMKEEFEEKLRPYKEGKEKLRGYLLEMLIKSGQDSAKTISGTVYRLTRSSASLEDVEAFRRHVIGTETWDLLDWKANITAVEDFLKANDHLPPGVKITRLADIGVRAPTGSRKTTVA